MATTQHLIAELALAHPKFLKDIGNARATEVVRLYVRRLDDIPAVVLAAVIDELINTERWFPSIAEIRERCAERVLALPDEAEALKQIERHMEWTRDRDGERPFVHPLVRASLDHVGGFSAMRDSREPTVLRGQFWRLYNEARAREIRSYQVNPNAITEGGSRHGVS